MSKFVCTVCGYVHEGDSAPEQCPVCKVGADKFKEQSGERVWASEHVVGQHEKQADRPFRQDAYGVGKIV